MAHPLTHQISSTPFLCCRLKVQLRALSSVSFSSSFRIQNELKSDSTSDVNIFNKHSFVRTLEISTVKDGPWSQLPKMEEDGSSLIGRGIVHATVHPDLPKITKFSQLLQMPNLGENNGAMQENDPGTVVAGFQIRTVAAQTKSMGSVVEGMKLRVSEMAADGALLLVSGGHILRQVPLLDRVMPTNAIAMLREAHLMRQIGTIPSRIQLWAVENPLTNSPASLEKKIEAGAEAIITQPPLLPQKFHTWWKEIDKRGLLKQVPIIVGMPIISSSRNLEFWLSLTSAPSMGMARLHCLLLPWHMPMAALPWLAGPEANYIFKKFQLAEAAAGADRDQFYATYNTEAMQSLKQFPGIAGMHIMPVTKWGWRQLSRESFLSEVLK